MAAGFAPTKGRPPGRGPVQVALLAAIKPEPTRVRGLHKELFGMTDNHVRVALRVLVQQGSVVRVSRGVYMRAA